MNFWVGITIEGFYKTVLQYEMRIGQTVQHEPG